MNFLVLHPLGQSAHREFAETHYGASQLEAEGTAKIGRVFDVRTAAWAMFSVDASDSVPSKQWEAPRRVGLSDRPNAPLNPTKPRPSNCPGRARRSTWNRSRRQLFRELRVQTGRGQ